MKQFMKYLLILGLSIILTACAINRQKSDAKKLAAKVDAFRVNNNTRIEFLAFINLSKDYSYVVDSPLLIEKLISPNIAIVNSNGSVFAIEFVDKELAQSYPLLKVGGSALFQEGILLSSGSFRDDAANKTYNKFRICRSEECRALAVMSLAYMHKWIGVDSTIPKNYETGDLHKFLVDQNLLKETVPQTKNDQNANQDNENTKEQANQPS
ncbi:MAG: hypothetical protein FWE18_02375 [Alphaproteobacteria bacterium]|nr:hypothetical protein [Alphaproteobacteria bacterium]